MMRRFRRDRKGTAAIEFGMLAPVLFMSVVGIVALGVHFFQRDQIDEAVRLAVRDVVAGDIETQAAIQSAFSARLTAKGFDTVTPAVSILNESTGRIARVALSWDFKVAIPLTDMIDTSYNVDLDIPI